MKHPSSQDLLNLSLQNEGVTDRAPKLPYPIMAIDYGLTWCGIAYSPDGLLTLPLKVLSTDNLQKDLKQLMSAKSIKQLVFGLPIGANGTESPLAEKIRIIGSMFHSSLPVTYVDERFSSKATLRIAPKSTDREDDLAAQHILEYFLAQKQS